MLRCYAWKKQHGPPRSAQWFAGHSFFIWCHFDPASSQNSLDGQADLGSRCRKIRLQRIRDIRVTYWKESVLMLQTAQSLQNSRWCWNFHTWPWSCRDTWVRNTASAIGPGDISFDSFAMGDFMNPHNIKNMLFQGLKQPGGSSS